MADDEPNPILSEYPDGLFTRPDGSPDGQPDGQQVEVVRPPGIYHPVGLAVRWLTPGPGREALNEVLGGLPVLELDHLARAAAAGEPFRIDPLRQLGDREGWRLNSRLASDPTLYSLEKDGTGREQRGPRLDLLLSLELTLRCALKPFEAAAEFPTWVARSRQVYPALLAALDGEPLFEAA